MKRTFRTHFVLSPAERELIVNDYLHGNDTVAEVAKKHGVSDRALRMWLKKHRENHRRIQKALFLQEKTKEPNPAEMKPQSLEEENLTLKKELEQIKRALAMSELKNEALNTMIDLAEKQGIKIRKNSGAKQ